ncbi:MAG: twin-arginine translocation signal domain-containing protein, partial [Bacteroidota bacterium]
MPETNRRRFLKRAGIFSATAFFTSLAKPAWSRNLDAALRDAEGVSATDLATEEDFWYYIQQSF